MAKSGWATAGSVGAALLAHVPCCLPPILMSLGGASAGLATALQPYRPWLLGFAAINILAGFYLAYRPEKCAVEGCTHDHRPKSRWLQRTLSWGALAVFAWAFLAPAHVHEDAQVAAVATQGQTVTLDLQGVHCAAYGAEIQAALKAVPGVRSVELDEVNSRAIVAVSSPAPSEAKLKEAVAHATHAH